MAEADQLALDASVPVGAEISVTVRDLHALMHGSAEADLSSGWTTAPVSGGV